MSVLYYIQKPDELYHYGVKGMKWGIRHERHEQSEKSIGNRTKTIKKIAIATAVVAGASVAGYALHRYGSMNFDKVIKSGTKIQHMSRTTDELLDKPFYASYLKKDNKLYAANDLFGSHWNAKITAVSSNNIKIAGRKNAVKIYEHWLNTNPDAKARFGNQSYFSFNRNLNSPDYRDKKLFSSFYTELKKNGYDAIRDMNDQTQSGAISPVIVFGSLKDIKISDITKI